MVPKKLIVATRSSRLALTQTDEAIEAMRTLWPDTNFEIIACDSPGDRDLVTALTDESVPDDFFTRDIDQMIIQGRADLAVHSAKDLPNTLHPELSIAALLPARDIRDAVVVRKDIDHASKIRVIGTSSLKRETGIRECYPTASIKGIRGTIDQRLEQLDQGEYDAIIVAACALERLGLADRIHAYLPYDPTPQQGRLAIVAKTDRPDLFDALRQLDIRQTAGLVAIVGCPADSAALSLRAQQYLQHADIVFHDRLLPDAVLLMIRDKAHPVGKAGGDQSTSQQDIHRQMLHAAEKGQLVVRLKGGDPLIFAHLAEELEFLNAWNLRVDLVPTLTAAQVAAARALAPLTHRDDGGQLHLVTGHTSKVEKLPVHLPGPRDGNLALYMSAREAQETQKRLIEAGWTEDTPVLIAERLGYRDEAIRYSPLSAMGDESIRTPAIFLLGVKSFTDTKRTLFVGTDPERFLNHGPLIHWPLIKLVSRPLQERAAALDATWSDIDGIIFPSRFAVTSFVEALLVSRDARALGNKRCLAVGPATAEALRSYAIRADAQVDHYGGIRSLASDLAAQDITGTFLYPCSTAAPTEERMAVLAKAGITARPAIFYENRHVEYKELPATDFHRVLFTSASTVEAYFKLYPHEVKANREWWAVGPSTAEAIQALGLSPATLPSKRSK